MLRSESKYKELQTILNKDNNLLITEAIGLLREEQPFEGAISLLVACYNKTEDVSIRKAIEGFMNDLKDHSACSEIIDEIKKSWKIDTINMLVSSCWQSGLNYSDYSSELAETFLKGNYITAFECLTVIEETSSDLSRKQKDAILDVFVQGNVPASDEKYMLVQELIAILKK
jgi:hypothetical protein